MTFSADARIAEMRSVLSLMLRHLGTQRICTTYFDATQQPFNGFLATTWLELTELHYIAPLFGRGPNYKLTNRGYVKALTEIGVLSSPQFKSDLGKLAATLKDSIKGRIQPAPLSVQTILNISGLDDGFVYNTIECNLLETILGMHGAHWVSKFEGVIVMVPITFGQQKVVF